MSFISKYDKNGDRDLMSVATTFADDENVVLLKLFKKLSSINDEFKSFFKKLESNKEKIDFYYFDFVKKRNK
jgi:hypothetical protein